MSGSDGDFIRRFTPSSFLADNWANLLIALVCFIGVAFMLTVLGISFQGTIVVCVFIFLCFAIALVVTFFRKKSFYDSLGDAAESLEKSYFLPEMIESPSTLDGQIAYDAVSRMGALSGSEAALAREEIQNYRDYVELWIHETKSPLAASKLILSRLHGSDVDKLATEIERIESQVEQALYYSRTTSLSNDYALKEVSLLKIVRDACKKNVRFLLEHGVSVDIDISEDLWVVADSSWVQFMLSQIIVNSTKYDATRIRFTAEEVNEGTTHEHTLLDIEDDGRGISASDITKVFDRGFVGSNGRHGGNATGMGLYLVSALVSRMDISVSISSREGVGTKVSLTFPHDRRRKSAQAGSAR